MWNAKVKPAYCHNLSKTLLKEPAVTDTTRHRRTSSAHVVFPEHNLTSLFTGLLSGWMMRFNLLYHR